MVSFWPSCHDPPQLPQPPMQPKPFPLGPAGVDLLRDGRDDTYWQSDGVQPHLITLQFQKKVWVAGIALQTDYKLDESYTPHRISIKAGSCWSDLREIRSVDLVEPQGWVLVPLVHDTTEQ